MAAGPDKRNPVERSTTDESLRTEREKADQELAASLVDIQQDADVLVAEARHEADAVLSDARHREDRKLAATGASTSAAQAVETTREREDAALEVARSDADVVIEEERTRRQVALASLLAYERHDTDLRLQIERTRADEAVTSREDFLAMVSHDLRSLLGGIALSADMLQALAKTDAPIAQVSHHADRIQRFSARMNRLVGDLMDVASIEAGKLSFSPELRDPALILRDAQEAFSPAAGAKEIVLSCTSSTDHTPIPMDPERILQVLTNLVGNALKFTDVGGRIAINLEPRGADVCFSVADTGEGVPTELLSKIFDRYYQIHDHDRRGLGLGLFIAKSIVEQHGGVLWAESKPGEGSTFRFTLPRSR